MKAALIFPPATDPRAPQLALPSLAAFLRPAGVETLLYDLNLRAVDELTRRDLLLESAERVRKKAGQKNEPKLSRLAAMSDHLAETAPKAVQVLRRESFFDARDYVAARDAVCAALDLVSAAAEREVSYNISPIRYDVAGVDSRSLRDLIQGTADPTANLFREHWENSFFPELSAEAPDLVGITITNRQQILPGLMLARALKARGHFVVLGGTVYTKFASKLGQRPAFFQNFADAVVVYEGETALLELMNQLAGKRDFSRVPNLLYLDGDRVQSTAHHVENVESLPTPDFAGLPLDNYLAPELVLPILTGKGCYFNRCKFCDIPYINHVSNKAYRIREPETIAADVRRLGERFGAKSFVITDEALSPKLLTQLADELAPSAAREQFSFTGYARLEDGFTAEVCKKLASMGMKKIFFGLESAAQETLDHMDKGVDISVVPRVLENCRDAAIDFHIFSIVGFPEENEVSARKTLQFFLDQQQVIDRPGNTFDIHPFGLELRTAYFDECSSMGVTIDAGALGRDFVIGLSSREWENSHGLNKSDVSRLLEEFNQTLRQTYRRWHNVPFQLWPGFEEYAVLYAKYFEQRDFRYGTCLPEQSSSTKFRLRFSPAFARHEDDAQVVFTGVAQIFTLSKRAAELLTQSEPRTIEQFWLDLLPVATPEERAAQSIPLRARIEELIGAALLQVELLP